MTLNEQRERLLKRLRRLDEAEAVSRLVQRFRQNKFLDMPDGVSIHSSSDYYPALCAFIDELDRVSEEVVAETCDDVPDDDGWISVDDERKPDHLDVLLYFRGGHQGTGYLLGKRWVPDNGSQVGDITHWRPLPKGPRDD